MTLASALLVLAGTAAAQTSGGTSGSGSSGSGSTSGGQTSGSQTQSQTNQQNQTNRTTTNQQNQANQNQANQPNQQTRQDLLESGRAVGDRSRTGDGLGARSQPSGANLNVPSQNDQFFPTPDNSQLPRGTPTGTNTNRSLQNVDLNGLVRNGQLDGNFVNRLTPAQRAALVNQLNNDQFYNDFDGGDGVAMSTDRYNRLYGDQNQEQQPAFGGQGVGGAYGGSTDLATSLQRLSLLEQQMAEHNDMLLRRLGQARQMSDERQIRAIADVMQEMILQRSQMVSYMGELRVALSEQAGYPAIPATESRMPARSYAAPERSDWENERSNTARRDTPNLTPYRGTDMYDEQGRRWR
jgi:hypothetical protein